MALAERMMAAPHQLRRGSGSTTTTLCELDGDCWRTAQEAIRSPAIQVNS